MKHFLIASLVALPGAVFAAGGNDNSPPVKTQTTTVCEEGFVWDEKSKACVAPQESSLSDDQRYDAVRELAYDGQYGAAQIVLAAMADQNDDRVLTYWGFTHRKMGDTGKAMAYYSAALTRNPDNLLARSYMGQAHVAAGDMVLAQAQLTEIKARGGRESWPAKSLQWAISSGQGFSY